MIKKGESKETMPTLHRRWYEAHSLLGMWALLPLFIMLACGTVSFFRDSLKAWHTPSLQHHYHPSADDILSSEVNEAIQTVPAEASLIWVYFPSEELPITKVRHRIKGHDDISIGITPEGEIIPHTKLDSKVSEHIYKWHYLAPFQGDKQAMMEQFTGIPSDPKPSGILVGQLPDFQPFIDQAKLELNDNAKLDFIIVRNPFDEKGVLNLRFTGPNDYKAEVKFLLHESTEAVLVNQELKTNGINKVLRPIFKLHFGDYAWFIKCIYVLISIFLCLLTTAGARLYIKRKETIFPRATQFFERIFDGLGIGILPAIAILVLSNRLLPDSLENRGIIEVYIFHISWISIGLFFLFFGSGPKRRKILYYTALSGLSTIPWLDGLLYQNWLWSEKIWFVPSVGWTNIVLLTLLPTVVLLQIAYRKARLR